MAKLFRLRDYILLSAALAGDILEEFRLAGGLVPAAMKGRYGFVPPKYKKASYLSTVSRMFTTGDINKVTDSRGKVYLELTSIGAKKLKRRFPLFLQDKKWDGLFMVVIFDIPEENRIIRNQLRHKLQKLGFGMLQKSVWISPYHFEEDMREFLAANGLGDSVFVLSARQLFAGNTQKLAARVWNLSRVNKGYLNVLKKTKKSKGLKKGKKGKVLDKAYTLYLDTLNSDPILPEELLLGSWAREKAVDALNQVI